MTTTPHPAPGTLIMGVVNLTPDSFSDGGQYSSPEQAVEHARAMIAAGADIIDAGAESTRPGAEPVEPEDEQARLLPVVELLLQLDTRISIDTRHSSTAWRALELAGPRAQELIINDVSGLVTDAQMPETVAAYGSQVVITHNRGTSTTMQEKTDYDDVVVAVVEELTTIRQLYLDAGVAAQNIILDPGIGFAKTHQQNWELIGGLDRVLLLGHRVLFGASRKGFLGGLLADAAVDGHHMGSRGAPRPPDQRDAATAALSFHAARAGCWAVRVHDVRTNSDAVRVASALD